MPLSLRPWMALLPPGMQSAERLFGYKPEEIIGQSVLRLIPRDLHFEEPQIIAKLRNGERIEHYETRRMRKNGEIFDISLTVSPVRDQKGRVVGASKIVRDISERKLPKPPSSKRRSWRLRAVWPQPSPMRSTTLSSRSPISLTCWPTINRSMRKRAIRRAPAQRGSARRRNYPPDAQLPQGRSRKNSGEHHRDPGAHCTLEEKEAGCEGIELKLEFDDPPRVSGYSGELRQVFDNLIENAIDATPSGGTIRIRARGQRSGQSQAAGGECLR